MFGFRRRKKEATFDFGDLKFFEVTVAPNEVWTIWNKPSMPLVFPTHTFSRFINVALGEQAYSEYALANVRSNIQGGLNKEVQETLLRTWDALDKELVAWRDYTLDSYVSLPTFCYFGDDAVKAIRAVVSADIRRRTGSRGWSEVPVSIRSNGTIIYRRQNLIDEQLYPEVCVPHQVIRCVVGTAWNAQAYLDDSVLDVIARTYTDLTHDVVANIVSRPPTSEFTLMLIKSFLEHFDLDRSTDWRVLTRDYIPAHLKWTDTRQYEEIPEINPLADNKEFIEQLWKLILWSYHAGILCRVYMWIDGKFGARRPK